MSKRSAWEEMEIIHRPDRANANDYIRMLFTDFFELHGDRLYGDDPAIRGGIALFDREPVTVLAQIKGKNLQENKQTNFSMPHPEGYRKAVRLAKEAEKFQRPVICLVDTPGAFCGVGAEERGQGEAIANSLQVFMRLRTPVVSIILGEGGSGGALAMAVCDQLAMLENAIYSVAAPRSAANILWKDVSREKDAANALKITAEDLKNFGVCDIIVPEGNLEEESRFKTTVQGIRLFLQDVLRSLERKNMDTLLEERYQKFRKLGAFADRRQTAGHSGKISLSQ